MFTEPERPFTMEFSDRVYEAPPQTMPMRFSSLILDALSSYPHCTSIQISCTHHLLSITPKERINFPLLTFTSTIKARMKNRKFVFWNRYFLNQPSKQLSNRLDAKLANDLGSGFHIWSTCVYMLQPQSYTNVFPWRFILFMRICGWVDSDLGLFVS